MTLVLISMKMIIKHIVFAVVVQCCKLMTVIKMTIIICLRLAEKWTPVINNRFLGQLVAFLLTQLFRGITTNSIHHNLEVLLDRV